MLKLQSFLLQPLVTGIVLFLLWMKVASAQIVEPPQKTEVPPTTLRLTPCAAPQPKLKYLLLPTIIDQQPGNAAVHYGKVKSEQNYFFTAKEVADAIESAQNVPLSALKDDHSFDQLVNLGPIFNNMQRGARSSYVDWQLPLRDAFFTELLLPEVQESRQFVRILHGRARVQIARGDFDGAVETIQTGMALGRHVGDGPTLINGLVGLVAMDTMLSAVQEMIIQPGAPNMYWALAELPSPLVDMHRGLEAERYMLYFTEEGWRHPEKLEGDEHFWRRELVRLWSYVSENRFDKAAATSDPKLSLYVIRGYAEAKQRLVARGIKADEVEAMPVSKVIMLDALHQYNCNVQEAMCRTRQALAEPSRLPELRRENSLTYPESLPISQNLGVATLNSVAQAVLRIERHRAAIQVVEALRLHAAQTGKLPDRLNTVTAVHLPVDPATGSAFAYERTDDAAILSSSTVVPELRLNLSLTPTSK